MSRLHRARFIRRRSVRGSSSLKTRKKIAVSKPSETGPARARIDTPFARPTLLNRRHDSPCHRPGNGATGGRNPAATATSSHRSGGISAQPHHHDSADNTHPRVIAQA